MKKAPIIFLIIVTFLSCKDNEIEADAYGHFEATEIFISMEASGKLINVNFRQGDRVEIGDTLAVIDNSSLLIKQDGFGARRSSILAQVAVIKAQKETASTEIQGLEKEFSRIKKLVESGAATLQQFDAIEHKLNVAKSMLKSFDSQISAVYKELLVLDAEERVLLDQLSKSYLISVIEGTVVEKYQHKGELASPGKLLAKIANLDEMFLRAYVSGSQLSDIKMGEAVEVRIDDSNNDLKSLTGTVTWVSSKSEFTPKIIQTKKERVNLVYAIKVRVDNTGEIKIGMPGEVIIP